MTYKIFGVELLYNFNVRIWIRNTDSNKFISAHGESNITPESENKITIYLYSSGI